jgi:hypothetical protein
MEAEVVDTIQKLIENRKNFTRGRLGNTISGIVLHTEVASRIEGMEDRSLYDWFNTNSRQVSAHYYVTFNGNIEQYVLDNDTAHHAGDWNVNLRTIGIEHQDNGFYLGHNKKYTDMQYEASAQLVASLCRKYQIPIQHVNNVSTNTGVTIHNQVPNASTSCPSALDFRRIIDRARDIATDSYIGGDLLPLNFPLRGLHGDGAADWMLKQKVNGWAVEPVYADGEFGRFQQLDFSEHEANGIRVIARWSNSYATDLPRGSGTYPIRDRYDDFADWCVNNIQNSQGVWGHIIGNEPNRSAERPQADDPITEQDVVYLYNKVRSRLKGTPVRLSPPAVDPTNFETGDPRKFWQIVLRDIDGAEFFALHAISYGSDQAVDSDLKFSEPAMSWQYRSFRMWQPMAHVLREEIVYRRTPLVITKTNHHHVLGVTNQRGWDQDASHWIHRVYEYLADWNMASSEQYIFGACLYRLQGEDWGIANKPKLISALIEAGDHAL